MPRIRIRFVRPGSDTEEWTQDLIEETPEFLLSKFTFQIEEPLIVDGRVVIADGHAGLLFEMVRDNVEVVAVFDRLGRLTGYYVNLNSEPRRFEGGYEVTDWFLDVWVFPDLRYRVLDADEFEDAVSRGLLSADAAAAARRVLAGVEAALTARDFPPRPIREYFLRARRGSPRPAPTKSR